MPVPLRKDSAVIGRIKGVFSRPKQITRIWLVVTVVTFRSHGRCNMAATTTCGTNTNISENNMSLKRSVSTASPLVLRIIAECPVTKARACDLVLPHSAVSTPVFMPVGTQGTMKGITVDQLDALGCQICLGNTYHLGMRPVINSSSINFDCLPSCMNC